MADCSLGAVKVEELLKEVRVDYYVTGRAVESFIKAVRKTLLSLADHEISSALAAATVKDLGVPDVKAGFKFVKPDSVVVVGSYASKTLTKPCLDVDLAVRMPKACFREKDFLNHRYYAKRLLYLVHLERELLMCPDIARTEWVGFNDDPRKPILVLHPVRENIDATSKVTLRILPTVAVDLFEASKLGLGRSNAKDAKASEGLSQSTPHYSSGIVEDMLMEDISIWLQTEQSKYSNIRDAISLAKVWLRQRKTQGHGDGMGGFLASVLFTHLLTPAGKLSISEHMSSIQAFRVFLDAIGNADILGKGIFLQQSHKMSLTTGAGKVLRDSFDVVVSDPSGRLNLAHRFSKGALIELKEDARHTLDVMTGAKDMGFEATFMTPVDFTAKFDYHVRVEVPAAPLTVPCNLNIGSWHTLEERIDSLLMKALSDRARFIRIIQRSLPSDWTPSMGLKCVGTAPIFAGIVLNTIDIALRMADIGPSADDKDQAKKFRSFWGERSELRQFKDGKISETAVWEIEPWKRHHIIQQIVSHALCRHLSLSPASIKVTAGQLDFALNVREKDQIAVMPTVLEALNALSEKLRKIENLPLKIVSVQPLSAVFRYAAVYYPVPHPWASGKVSHAGANVHGGCLDPLEVVLQLEGSGRWPDDLVAIQKTKSAFLFAVAKSFQQLWGISCVASESGVDILLQGFAFRLCVHYEKDVTHLNKERIASSMVKGKAFPLQALSGVPKIGLEMLSLKSDLLLRSMHASMLHGLHGLYPAYSPTVRLAKRWLSAHLLSGALGEEAVELLVAHLFVRPAPYAPPGSRITGFLRFLQLIGNYDWALAPLIVDVNGDMTSKDEELVQAQFDRVRQTSQDVQGDVDCQAMYIATAYDMGSETWTRSLPTSKGLKRLVTYARSAAPLLCMKIRGEGDDAGWQTLFKTSLESFDVLVSLHHKSLPQPSRLLFPGVNHIEPIYTAEVPRHPLSIDLDIIRKDVKTRGVKARESRLLIGFNTISTFVDDLRCRLGNSCSIWYDSDCCDVIGFNLTKPSRPPAEGQIFKRKKVNDQCTTVESLVSVILDVGEGLVKSIYLPEKGKNKKLM